MDKNDKESYIAPRVKSVAFNVESGYQVSPGGDVFMQGFLRDRNPYREFDMDEGGLFGGNSYGNGSGEGYFTRELNVE